MIWHYDVFPYPGDVSQVFFHHHSRFGKSGVRADVPQSAPYGGVRRVRADVGIGPYDGVWRTRADVGIGPYGGVRRVRADVDIGPYGGVRRARADVGIGPYGGMRRVRADVGIGPYGGVRRMRADVGIGPYDGTQNTFFVCGADRYEVGAWGAVFVFRQAEIFAGWHVT